LITRPLKELKAFKRVHLEPGQTCTVTFHLPVNALAYLNRDMQLVVEPGTVDVMVGSSSADIHQTGTFEIVGATTSVDRVFTTTATVKAQ
jgi:beta-glucosidase